MTAKNKKRRKVRKPIKRSAVEARKILNVWPVRPSKNWEKLDLQNVPVSVKKSNRALEKFSYTYRPTAELRKYSKWPGARLLKLPFKTAVEQFLLKKYAKRIKSGNLSKDQIRSDDPELYIALKNYHARFGRNPFDIPSTRDLAQTNLIFAATYGLQYLAAPAKRSALFQARRFAHSRNRK